MRTTSIMQAIALCAVAFTAERSYAVQECAELEGKSVEESAKYLAQPRASVEDRCVSYAMDQIGAKQYVPAAQILVQYVDYQVRDFSHEQNSRVRFGLGRSGAFPAVDALFEIGPPAIIHLANYAGVSVNFVITDAQHLLPAVGSCLAPAATVGVLTPNGAFQPATVVSRNGSVVQATVTVPHNQPATTWLFSRTLKFQDSSARPVAAGAGAPITPPSGITDYNISLTVSK